MASDQFTLSIRHCLKITLQLTAKWARLVLSRALGTWLCQHSSNKVSASSTILHVDYSGSFLGFVKPVTHNEFSLCWNIPEPESFYAYIQASLLPKFLIRI